MNFIKHSNLEGKHALLGASRWQWLNDDEESLLKRIRSAYATEVGTLLHSIAAERIKYGFKLAKSDKKQIIFELLKGGIPESVVDSMDMGFIFDNMANYVNDCIGFKMTPEVVLYFSDYCFGTADAIKYSEKDHQLRIHDLKTGTTPAHMEQLLIYVALFCLEYHIKPYEIETELRLYQSNEVLYFNPTVDDIVPIIDKILTFDKYLKKLHGREV
jgi:hypothetical protein